MQANNFQEMQKNACRGKLKRKKRPLGTGALLGLIMNKELFKRATPSELNELRWKT
jgi:hypothetical protein